MSGTKRSFQFTDTEFCQIDDKQPQSDQRRSTFDNNNHCAKRHNTNFSPDTDSSCPIISCCPSLLMTPSASPINPVANSPNIPTSSHEKLHTATISSSLSYINTPIASLSSSNNKPKHLKSCSRCRKHKTKCNYIETAPNSCSSCFKRGLTCQLEVVIPVKRSNIIKNISTDISYLKETVNSLIKKNNILKSALQDNGIQLDGFIDIDPIVFEEPESNAMNGIKREIPPTGNAAFEPVRSSIRMEEPKAQIEKPLSKIENGPVQSVIERSPSAENMQQLNTKLDYFCTKYQTPVSQSLITPPNSTHISPQLSYSDMVYRFNHDDSNPNEVAWSHSEILNIFDRFNTEYLPFLPIMEKVDLNAIHDFYVDAETELLFWSIIYLVTSNVDVFTQYIIREILEFNSDPNDRNVSKIKSILLLSYFPTKSSNASAFNVDSDPENSDLDSCIFQWLETSFHKFCNIYDVVKLNLTGTNSLKNSTMKNIWAAFFILGTSYGFRLNMKWNQRVDFVLEDFKDNKGSFLARLLDLSVFFSRILDSFVFNPTVTADNENENDQLWKLKSISNWRFKLKNQFENDSQDNMLNLFVNFIDLTLVLFQPQNQINIQSQLVECIRLITSLNGILNEINNLTRSPMFVKISLEFALLCLIQVSYTPLFLQNCESSNFLLKDLFKKLIRFVEFNDTKYIFDLIIDFDSLIKCDSVLFDCFNTLNFQEKLLTGMVKDVKMINNKFKSLELNEERINFNTSQFYKKNLNYRIFAENFNDFKEDLNLVILYSNEILKNDNDLIDINESPNSESSELREFKYLLIKNTNTTINDITTTNEHTQCNDNFNYNQHNK